jgi:polar amino acid transport system substrate-binding protein
MRFVASLIMALLLPLTPLSVVAADKVSDTLVVAVNHNDKPFGWTNERGELTGFSVDIARALCRAMNRECRLVPTAFAEFVGGVADGRFDFVVANMLRTAEREKLVDFTDRFWRSSSNFVGQPGGVSEISEKGLKGKTIAMLKGSVQERYLRKFYEGVVTITPYPTAAERNAALAAGRADLIFGSTLSNYSFLLTKEGSRFEFIGDRIYDHDLGGDVALPVAKGREDLRRALNTAIATILRDGTYARIGNTYFSAAIF